MKLVIMRSRHVEGEQTSQSDYLQEFNTRFAERVIGNLVGSREFCTACSQECNSCREPYRRRYAADIAAVIDFPAIMPYMLEKPAEHVPADVPRHEILLIINVHEQVLLEILGRCMEWGTRGVVVPLEAPDWVSGATRVQAREICSRNGIEVSFPKPFCAFRPPQGTVLDQFRQYFHVGYPDVEISTRDGIITGAVVKVSAACGATYYVARGLPGRNLNENIEIEVISKRMHSYPCMASMERDPELDDDTAMHIAGKAHKQIIRSAGEAADDAFVVSPLGKVVQKPVSRQDTLKNIEQAKEVILGELRQRPVVTLEELKQVPDVTPAALHSALLLLKKEGSILFDSGRITSRV